MIESIIPCIKITQTNGMSGFDMYIEEGDKIKFITKDEREISGTFMFIELSQYEGFDDLIHVKLGSGEFKVFGTSEIERIVD